MTKSKQIHAPVKLRWSHYALPGFKPAKNGNGYIPDDEADNSGNPGQGILCKIPKIIYGKGRIQA